MPAWYVSYGIRLKKAAKTTKALYEGQPDIGVHFQKYHCVPYIRILLSICIYIIRIPGKSKDGINDRSSEMILLAKSTSGPIR